MTGDASVGLGDATLGGVVGSPPVERHSGRLSGSLVSLVRLVGTADL
jgi:hypothetical protein